MRVGFTDRPRHVAVIAAGLLAVLSAVPASAAARAGEVPRGAVRLSDELKLTRWAHAISLAPIRATPSHTARTIGRLRLLMEGKRPEVYIVLHSFLDTNGTRWLRVRVPGRPNGRIGWVSSKALGDIRRTATSIEIRRRSKRIIVRRNGKAVLRARVGIGKRGTPTPAGQFVVRERFKVPVGTLYGTRALGTSAYAPYLTDWPQGGIIGIHGTNQPQLIPGRPSHGCVRMKNRDIQRLYRIVRIGTPIRIR